MLNRIKHRTEVHLVKHSKELFDLVSGDLFSKYLSVCNSLKRELSLYVYKNISVL